MNKITISAKQMEATVALYLLGSSLVSSGTTQAKQDTWFCILVAMVLIVPMAWVHFQILNLYPGQNYFQNIFKAMGRPAGTAVCALMTLYFLHLGAIVLRIFGEFIHIVNMTETPVIMILVSITACLAYVLSRRLYVLARLCKFVLPFLAVTVAMTIVLSYRDMNWDNLKPILHSSPGDLMRGILTSFAVPYGEIVVCVPMFGALDRSAKAFPTLLKGILLSFLILFSANLRNVLVLGYATNIYNFPSYEAVSVIKIGEFFTRVEVLIGINLLLAGFVKAGVLLYSSCEGLSKLFGYQDYEPLVAPVSLLILTISVLVHKNTVEMYEWLGYLPAYSLPFQVFLPILVLIVGKIRKKFQSPRRLGKKPEKKEQKPVSPSPQES